MPGPGQGAEADMALETRQRSAGDVADLGEFEVAQWVLAGQEGVEAVEIARRVQRDAPSLPQSRGGTPVSWLGAVGLVPVGRRGGVHGHP
ncbi:putative uncharacterized protein [Streptomyces azureus]|uniref:Uncharacterized protein n=1 Tax=Streptomyces azureus TaxID=146537 RepID=A0A0K8PDZ9_STRAJ|nr:putative uncharacterized protein [Streptomyces azureus]